MLLTGLESRRLLFVGGKGGVGKTTVGSAIACGLAMRGQRVLVASTDPAHSLGHLWRTRLSDEPRQLTAIGDGSVDGVELDPRSTVERHLASVEATMLRLLPERLHSAARSHIRRAADAPGSHESAMLERLAETVEYAQDDYDTVLFDTAPTGHTTRLISLPDSLENWTEQLLRSRDRSERYTATMHSIVTGRSSSNPESELRKTLLRRKERFANLRTLIRDANATGFITVTIAERMPLAESLELIADLQSMRVPIAGIVINRRSPSNESTLLDARHALETDALAESQIEPVDAPLVEIPLLAEDLTGEDAILRAAARL